MKIYLAKYSGFCSGVKRSAQLANAKYTHKPIFTWGPLIHNEQFVQYLESKGIKKTENLKDISNAIVIVRSHGIEKKLMQNIKKLSHKTIDGTCPNVIRVQKLAQNLQKKEKNIVIFGDSSHPEIIGIASYIKKPYIISNIQDLKLLPKLKNPALISQTTQSVRKFKIIAKKLKKIYPNIQIYNTICNATELRQKSANALSKKVDVMIVIGGQSSSNSKKLFDICKKQTTSYFIQTKKDLKNIDLKNIDKIGITAGASTPDWIIKNVVQYLKSI